MATEEPSPKAGGSPLTASNLHHVAAKVDKNKFIDGYLRSQTSFQNAYKTDGLTYRASWDAPADVEMAESSRLLEPAPRSLVESSVLLPRTRAPIVHPRTRINTPAAVARTHNDPQMPRDIASDIAKQRHRETSSSQGPPSATAPRRKQPKTSSPRRHASNKSQPQSRQAVPETAQVPQKRKRQASQDPEQVARKTKLFFTQDTQGLLSPRSCRT